MRIRPRLTSGLAVALLLSLIVLFYWQYVFSTQFTFLEGVDTAYQVLPWYQVQARLWHSGVFPMWDPYAWAGQSLLGQMQPGAAFPLNWPLFWAPLKDGNIQLKFIHWHYALIHLIAGLGMYLLARRLRLSRIAAVFSGVAFACLGYVGTITWPQMLHGAVWLPWTFFFFHRASASGRSPRAWCNAVWCGGSIGLSVVSGHHQTPFYSLLALGMLFAYLFARRIWRSPRTAWRLTAQLAVAGLTAAAVGGLQLLPAYEYGRHAYRWVGAELPVGIDRDVPYYVHDRLKLEPLHALGVLLPRTPDAANAFAGFSVAVLAALGLGRRRRALWTPFYGVLALAALFFSFGPQTVFHGWIYSLIPFADKARSPGHAVFVFQFAVILTAAHGLDRLRTGPRSASDRRFIRRVAAVTALIAGALLLTLLVHAGEPNFGPYYSNHVAFSAIVALVAAACLRGLAGQSRPGAASWALLALMLLEAGNAHSLYVVDRRDPDRAKFIADLEQPAAAIQFLQRQPKPFRFEYLPGGDRMHVGGWHGLESVHGFLASAREEVYGLLERYGWDRGRLMWNTVYTIARAPARENQTLVFEGEDGWNVYRNGAAWPRAWIERDPTVISAAASGPAAPEPGNCDGDEPVRYESWTPQSFTVTARLNCGGYLVLSEPFEAGWKARSGAGRLPVHRAFGGMRAVYLAAGHHEIEFFYRPASVVWGGALTAAGFAVCVAAFLWRRRYC